MDNMEMELVLIRNGGTALDLDGRYCGSRDEELTASERTGLRKKAGESGYPEVQLVYTAGTLRCRQTAQCIYPAIPAIVLKELSPADLGFLTGMQYREAVAEDSFQRWTGSREASLPGAEETLQAFHARILRALRTITKELEQKKLKRAAVITHRLNIEKLLQRYCLPRNHYSYREIGHGEGILIAWETRFSTAKVKKIIKK